MQVRDFEAISVMGIGIGMGTVWGSSVGLSEGRERYWIAVVIVVLPIFFVHIFV